MFLDASPNPLRLPCEYFINVCMHGCVVVVSVMFAKYWVKKLRSLPLLPCTIAPNWKTVPCPSETPVRKLCVHCVARCSFGYSRTVMIAVKLVDVFDSS